jgi:hypothetical protein
MKGMCASVKKLRLRLHPDFDTLLAQQGYSVRAFAREYDLSHQTLFALLRPEWQPKNRSGGGMRKPTAWKIARAWAQVRGITPDEAFAEVIIEEFDELAASSVS